MTRVAIPIIGASEDTSAPMDPRFGRAARFLIVDAESSKVLHSIANPAVDAEHGAGTGAATLMKEHGVDAVIAGRFGPKAFEALNALGIEPWIAPPGLMAAQVLGLYVARELEQMEVRVIR